MVGSFRGAILKRSSVNSNHSSEHGASSVDSMVLLVGAILVAVVALPILGTQIQYSFLDAAGGGTIGSSGDPFDETAPSSNSDGSAPPVDQSEPGGWITP